MTTTNTSLYGNALETRDLQRLRREVQQPSRESVHQVAKQFEALFVQTMLKSMRSASMGDSLMGGQGVKQYRQIYDQQLSMNIAQGRGLGLAPFVEQQMLRHSGLEGTKPAGGGRQAGDYLANPVPSARTPDAADAMGQRQDVVGASPSGPSGAVSTPGGKGLVWDSPETFVRDIWPMAKRTAQSLGVSPRALVAQAALETGWGQHVIRRPDGSSSNNLFNIKAHAGWNGDSVGVPTLEYRDGVAVRETAQFRAYDSLQQAFDDYGSFLRAHPRYSGALEAGEDAPQFLRGLQRAGYATDPGYAEKIERILGSDVFSSLESPLKNSGDGTTT